MKSSASRILSIVTAGFAISSFSTGVFASSFDMAYQGTPDLVFNVLEQKTAATFTFIICNQGDIGTGNGKFNIVLQSNEGKIEERTYENINLSAGSCTNLTMYSVDGYAMGSKRKSAITGTVRFVGDRTELRTANNKIVLLAKKSRADVSDINYRSNSTKTVSNDPVYDLWGNSDNTTKWYSTPQNNNYYDPNNYNSNGFSSNGYYNNTTNYNNGYVNQTNPTWSSASGNQNLVYVYTGYNNGGWYNYTPNGYGNYTYTPYNNYTNNGVFYNNDYNQYPTFNANQPNGTNSYYIPNTYVPYNNNGNSYNTFAPGNYNSSCQQWLKTWDNYSQTYQWKCSNNYSIPVGTPDLYLGELRQNGGNFELIAKVCNQ